MDKLAETMLTTDARKAFNSFDDVMRKKVYIFAMYKKTMRHCLLLSLTQRRALGKHEAVLEKVTSVPTVDNSGAIRITHQRLCELQVIAEAAKCVSERLIFKRWLTMYIKIYNAKGGDVEPYTGDEEDERLHSLLARCERHRVAEQDI